MADRLEVTLDEALLDELQDAALEDAALIDAMTKQFADELHQVLRLATAQVRDLIRQLERDASGRIATTQQNLARAGRLRTDLIRVLQQAGYTDLIARSLDAPLDELVTRTLGGRQVLSTFDLDALVAMKEMRLGELLLVGEDAGIQLWRVTLDGVLGVRRLDDLVDDIADMLDASEKVARQVFDTAVSTFSRQVGQLHARGTADEEFVYVGPLDKRTRPFCRNLVETVHTRAEIDAMDNGQLPNVLLTGGGWNCRHQWRRADPLDTTTRRGRALIEDDEE